MLMKHRMIMYYPHYLMWETLVFLITQLILQKKLEYFFCYAKIGEFDG